jgi:serine palmitoyltransferase
MPALLATSATEAIGHLRNTPSVLTTLHDNVDTIRSVLEKTEGITILGHRASPIIHFCLRSGPQYLTATPSAPDHEEEEWVLQDIVDDVLTNGVFITRGKHLRGQEMIDSRPTIRIAATAALSKKDVEKAMGVVKASIARVLARRR